MLGIIYLDIYLEVYKSNSDVEIEFLFVERLNIAGYMFSQIKQDYRYNVMEVTKCFCKKLNFNFNCMY